MKSHTLRPSVSAFASLACLHLLTDTPMPPLENRRVEAALAVRQQSSSLELSLQAVRSITSRLDSVEVEYFVRNQGAPIRFRNLPEAYRFDVIDPTGNTVEPQWKADYEPPMLGDLVDLTIPRGGIVGQRVRLTCVVNGYYQRIPSPDWCGWGYAFRKVGVYRIAVRYTAPAEGGVVLTSDTVTIEYKPIP